jgi:chromosome segregation ATPase
MQDRLNGLLGAYLRLLSAAQLHRDLLRNTDSALITRELKQLQADISSQPAKVQDINRKRIEILNKRLEKYGKLQENAKVIDAQLAAIEDVLQLIRDQSVSLRDPQQVSEQLGGLVHEVEQTEQTVQEVEAIFQLAEPEFASQELPGAASSDPNVSSRSRIRS